MSTAAVPQRAAPSGAASSKATAVTAWESLFRAQVTVMRQIGTEFPAGEITLTEYDVMFNLSRQPDRSMRIRDLVPELLLSQPSVSRLVDRLAARGLLSKSPDPGDARGVIVSLTPGGFALYRAAATAHMASIADHVGGALDDAELQQLTALCDKLRERVLAQPQHPHPRHPAP